MALLFAKESSQVLPFNWYFPFFLWYPLSALDILAVSFQLIQEAMQRRWGQQKWRIASRWKTNYLELLNWAFGENLGLRFKTPRNDVFSFLNVWWHFGYDGSRFPTLDKLCRFCSPQPRFDLVLHLKYGSCKPACRPVLLFILVYKQVE